MRDFFQNQTDEFFTSVFAPTQIQSVRARPDTGLHHRDRLLIERILPRYSGRKLKIMDFGCGQGRLLGWLLQNGYDAIGIERSAGMIQHAIEETRHFGRDRVKQGSLDILPTIESTSFDMIIVMGVVQYLSIPDYQRLFTQLRRILTSEGVLICTFQNAFFDLFTFNKYTVDCVVNELIFDAQSDNDAEQRSAVARSIESLLTNAACPDYSPTRARDNIYVRLSNPLLVEEHLQEMSFTLVNRYFYEYFGLPPLIGEQHIDLARRIASRYEVLQAESWRGTFMANAFLVEAKKNVV